MWNGSFGLGERGRNVVEDRLEERRHVLLLFSPRCGHHVAVAAGAVDDRGVELLLGGVELQQEFEHLVVHLRRARRSRGRSC
jgi:hypothetical protein